MKAKSFAFQKTLLSSSITAALIATSAVAMAQDDMLEEVEVTGVRAAQASSVNTKRFANSVVDGISAEDIGKLPDVTISDSLQRIPGIQVERTAGEGGPVQIRGLANVDTMLNGESFLSATTIDESGADFGDLPSQLFSGADVYKSPLATLPSLGVTGTVDLKTRRPFDMDEGFSFAGQAEIDRGSESSENDPTLSGLINWRNDRVGFLISAVTTEKNLSTDYNGYFDTSENGAIGNANNNHIGWEAPDEVNPDIYYVVPQGFSAFNKEEERNRDGVNMSFQADLGEGFEVVADYFYSKQERYNRRAGVAQHNRWQTFNNYARPTEFSDNDFTYDGNDWRVPTAFDLRPYRLQSFTQNNKNTELSQNTNVELNFDNGGALTGQVRATRASAKAQMRHGYTEGDILSIDEGSLVTGPGGLVPAEFCNAADGDIIVGEDGGCFARYSEGIQDDDFLIGYDTVSRTFTGFDQMVDGGKGMRTVADYMADQDSYHIGAFSSEGNTDDKASLDTFSTSWNYKFDDTPFITSVDFGMRQSDRSIEHEEFSYFNDGICGMSAQWKAVDQFAIDENDCAPGEAWGEEVMAGAVDQAGNPVSGFVPYTFLPPTAIDQHANAIWIDSFAGVSGLPGVWAVDPKAFDDTRAFQESIFGAATKVIQPGQSYTVDLKEFSYFLQGNFEAGDFAGNLGVKFVETDITVRQNEVGAQIAHSGVNVDTGDVVTKRSYTDTLPSLNVTYNITDDMKVRAAYGKTMQPLDLIQWGGGKSVGRVFNEDCQCMRVANGSFAGNANLDPTRADNFDLSWEWYLGAASMVSVGYFNIEIDSFVQSGTILVDEPDSDGVNRGPFVFNSPVQGTGGEVDGFEFAAKLAMSDFTDVSVLSDTGFDLNYTISDSSQDAEGANGELPFVGNSEDTYNIVAWYENDIVSARLAYNFRSERLITAGSSTYGGQSLYQDDYGQLDLNVTWNVTDQVSVYLNGSNINEEQQEAYVEFEEQQAFQNMYEARWALGARVSF